MEALKPNGLPADSGSRASVRFVVTYRRLRAPQGELPVSGYSGGPSDGPSDVEYELLKRDVTMGSDGVAKLSIQAVPDEAHSLRIYVMMMMMFVCFIA